MFRLPAEAARAVIAALRWLPEVSAVVVAYAAVLWAWRRATKAPPGPLFVLPLVGESVEFFKNPCSFMCRRRVILPAFGALSMPNESDHTAVDPAQAFLLH